MRWSPLAVLVLATCGPKSAPPPPLGNESTPSSAPTARVLDDGDYLCWGGFHEYLCTVRTAGGRTRLDKVGGSDRYHGEVLAAGGSDFRLLGANDAGASFDLHFVRQADGSWRADLPGGLSGDTTYYTIRYMGALGSVFGSTTYGGGYDRERDRYYEDDL